MIVEDDPDFQVLLTRSLDKLDIVLNIGIYGDSVKASIQIEKQKPDLVLLDINISGLDGPDFLKELEHQPKVIIISGYTEDIMDDFDIPYAAFIQKPFSLGQLKDNIEKALKQSFSPDASHIQVG